MAQDGVYTGKTDVWRGEVKIFFCGGIGNMKKSVTFDAKFSYELSRINKKVFFEDMKQPC